MNKHIPNFSAKEIPQEDIVSCSLFNINQDLSVVQMMKKKECYRNAALLTNYLQRTLSTDSDSTVYYVEGYVTINKSFPIEHAWVKIITDDSHPNTQEYIIDPTFEFVLGHSIEDIKSEIYYEAEEYTYDELQELMLRYKAYGPYYNRRTEYYSKSSQSRLSHTLKESTASTKHNYSTDILNTADIEDDDIANIDELDSLYEDNIKLLHKISSIAATESLHALDISICINYIKPEIVYPLHKSLFEELSEVEDLFVEKHGFRYCVGTIDCFGDTDIQTIIPLEDFKAAYMSSISFRVFFNKFRKIPFKRFHIYIDKIGEVVKTWAEKNKQKLLSRIRFTQFAPNGRDTNLNRFSHDIGHKIYDVGFSLSHMEEERYYANLYATAVLGEEYSPGTEYSFYDGSKNRNYMNYSRYINDDNMKYFADRCFKLAPELGKKFGLTIEPILHYIRDNEEKDGCPVIMFRIRSDKDLSYAEFAQDMYNCIIKNIPHVIFKKYINTLIMCKVNFNVVKDPAHIMLKSLKVNDNVTATYRNDTYIYFQTDNCYTNQGRCSVCIIYEIDGEIDRKRVDTLSRTCNLFRVFNKQGILSMTQADVDAGRMDDF